MFSERSHDPPDAARAVSAWFPRTKRWIRWRRRSDDLESSTLSSQRSDRLNSLGLDSLRTSSTALTSTVLSSDATTLIDPSTPNKLDKACELYGGWYIHIDDKCIISEELRRGVVDLKETFFHHLSGQFTAAPCITSKTFEDLPILTLLITCENEAQKKKAEQRIPNISCVKAFTKEYGLQLRFGVNDEIKLSSEIFEEASSSSCYTQEHSLKIANHFDTTCGLLVSLDGIYGQTSLCTCGGLVVLNGRLYASTTRHSFLNGSSDNSRISIPNFRTEQLASNVLFFERKRNCTV